VLLSGPERIRERAEHYQYDSAVGRAGMDVSKAAIVPASTRRSTGRLTVRSKGRASGPRIIPKRLRLVQRAGALNVASRTAERRLTNGVSFLVKFDGEFGDRSETYSSTGRIRYTW